MYQTNTLYLDRVSDFFSSLGFKPNYEILKEPPASGTGKLVKVTVEGFDWLKNKEWQNLPLEVIASQ